MSISDYIIDTGMSDPDVSDTGSEGDWQESHGYRSRELRRSSAVGPPLFESSATRFDTDHLHHEKQKALADLAQLRLQIQADIMRVLAELEREYEAGQTNIHPDAMQWLQDRFVGTADSTSKQRDAIAVTLGSLITGKRIDLQNPLEQEGCALVQHLSFHVCDVTEKLRTLMNESATVDRMENDIQNDRFASAAQEFLTHKRELSNGTSFGQALVEWASRFFRRIGALLGLTHKDTKEESDAGRPRSCSSPIAVSVEVAAQEGRFNAGSRYSLYRDLCHDTHDLTTRARSNSLRLSPLSS